MPTFIPTPLQTDRRSFLARGLAGTLGMVFAPSIQRQLSAAGPGSRARRCVVIWLNGGPSHIDTFDPKPGAPTNGPFKAINTTVAGIQLSEHLPRLATNARHLAFVRSMTSKEADHDRAYQFLHTGNLPQETVVYPALGSVVARRWSGEESTLPSYVAINVEGEGPGPGFFGLDFGPYVIADPSSPFDSVRPPSGVSRRRSSRRTEALEAFNRGFAAWSDPEAVADHARLVSKARRLMQHPSLKALDISRENSPVLARYGAEGDDGAFGRGCLLARRLLEQEVRFVEVVLDGWDTHTDNFNQTSALSTKLDSAFAALVGDLAERGMLDETLVICMGEFGRTPTINAESGRDHWSETFSVVLAGGGIRGGQALGASDAKGESVKDRPVTVPDLFATLLSAFGIDSSSSLKTPEGRPIRLVENGRVVHELFS